MNLDFNTNITNQYHSNTQKARVLTEQWVLDNLYCPRCGNAHILHFENNRPVADFYCPSCNNQFELKSKVGPIRNKINDGAYSTMISRITSNQNPDFLFMSYSKIEYRVKDLIIIPRHFFTPSVIEARAPLSQSARRAGWIGCNILIDKIPLQGRIDIVKDGLVNSALDVVRCVNRSNSLYIESIDKRSWLIDVLNCINQIPQDLFTLGDVYKFAHFLSTLYPQNKNVEAKIRQQLQILRDKGYIEFLGNGVYRKK